MCSLVASSTSCSAAAAGRRPHPGRLPIGTRDARPVGDAALPEHLIVGPRPTAHWGTAYRQGIQQVEILDSHGHLRVMRPRSRLVVSCQKRRPHGSRHGQQRAGCRVRRDAPRRASSPGRPAAPGRPAPHRIGRRRRDRAPGWPRRLDRHGQAADHAGGGRTVAVAAASNPERATMEVAMLIQHQHKLLQ